MRSEGRVLDEGIANVGRVGLGVFVRKGAAKPVLSSVEAFRKSLSSAKSIAYVDPAGGGASGIYVDELLEKLGLKAELASKVKIFPRAHNIVAAVVKGEVDFAFGQISEILDDSSIDLAGPLPDDIQNYTRFSAGVLASSKQPQPAKALDALCVCSDQTVNKREEDEAISFVSDLPFPVTSDVKEIAKFWHKTAIKLFFRHINRRP